MRILQKRNTLVPFIIFLLLLTALLSTFIFIEQSDLYAKAGRGCTISDIVSTTDATITCLIDGEEEVFDNDTNSGMFFDIVNIDDWNKLTSIVNGTDGFTANTFSGFEITLSNDLDFGWDGISVIENNFTPIGISYSTPFSPSSFYAWDNTSISGIYYSTTDDYAGLFGYIIGSTHEDRGTTLRNIIVHNSYFKANMAGGIAGTCKGLINGKVIIRDCHVNAEIYGLRYSGGITGHIFCGDTSTVNGCSRIEFCTSDGKVSGEQCVGGIVGLVEGVPIINCGNSAAVNGIYGDDAINIGGIAGNANNYSLALNHSTILNCYNTGTISLIKSGDNDPQGCYVGGLVGVHNGYTEAGTITSYILNSYNAGNFTIATGTDTFVGEYAGKAHLTQIDGSYCIDNGTDINYIGAPYDSETNDYTNNSITAYTTENLDNLLVALNSSQIANANIIGYTQDMIQWVGAVLPTNKAFPILDEVTPIKYYLTYNNEGILTETNYTSGRNTRLKNIVKPSYTFGGWYVNDNFSGEPLSVIDYNTTMDLTLYAKLTTNVYNINYNLDGGTNALDNVVAFTVNSGVITLAEPTKEGYSFRGWYTSSDFSGDIVTTFSASTADNLTFYAKWAKVDGNIINEAPGGLVNINDDNNDKCKLWWLGIVIPLALLLIIVIVIIILQLKRKISIPFVAKILDKLPKKENYKIKTETLENEEDPNIKG